MEGTSLIFPNDKVNCKNVVLIDNNVPQFMTFYNACNDNTFPIIYSANNSRTDILEVLSKFSSIDRLSLCFVNDMITNKLFLNNQMILDNDNSQFIISLINQYNIKNIDYLACNLLQDNNWKQYFENIKNQTNVIIGASDNRTGNLKYGGDWIMERTGQDIELIYFNESILNYSSLLDLTFGSCYFIDCSGYLYTCGRNYDGTLGNGSLIDRSFFTQVTGIQSTGFYTKKVKKAYLNFYNSFAITTDGNLYGCGKNTNGELGLTPTGASFTSFTFCMSGSIVGKNIVSVVNGNNYSAALDSEGKLHFTGSNGNSVFGIANSSLSSSYVWFLCNYNISYDGSTAQTIKVTDLFFSQIYCHDECLFLITDDGKLYASGKVGAVFNISGLPNILSYITRLDSTKDKTVVKVQVGINSLYILDNLGTFYYYGSNYYGQSGINGVTNANITTLTEVTSLKGIVKDFSACQYSSMILTVDGRILVTGKNDYGQLALPSSTTNLTVYTDLTSDASFNSLQYTGTISEIFSQLNSVFLLTSTNQLYVCGQNTYGIGLGTTGINYNSFVKITNITNYNGTSFNTDGSNTIGTIMPYNNYNYHISIGGNSTCLVTTNGKLFASGGGSPTYNFGFTDIPSINRNTFTQITNTFSNYGFYGKSVRKAVSSKVWTTYAITTDGMLYSCGLNSLGKLGVGDNNDRLYFTQAVGDITGKDLINIYPSKQGVIVQDSNKRLYYTGLNDNGQFATGTIATSKTDFKNSFTLINTDISYNGISTNIYNIPIKQICCGDYYTMLVTDDGKLYGSGQNIYGQLGLGDNINRSRFTQTLSSRFILKVACGNNFTYALDSTGNFWAAGNNIFGQLGFGDYVSRNTFTQMLPPAPLSGLIKNIYCGNYRGFVLSAFNRLYVTGASKNNWGILCDGSGNTQYNTFTEITNSLPTYIKNNIATTTFWCDNYENYMLNNDGSLYVCGYNSLGQFGTGNTTSPKTFTQVTSMVDVTGTTTALSGIIDQYSEIVSNICFVAGSIVLTDQGRIPIEKIDPSIHTINGQTILHVTKTYTIDKHLVCINKHAFSKNIPNKKTIVSKNHLIMYNKKMIAAKDLVYYLSGVEFIENKGELLYNLLLEKHSIMNINNLNAETLDPKNIVAKSYLGKISEEEKTILLNNNYKHLPELYKLRNNIQNKI